MQLRVQLGSNILLCYKATCYYEMVLGINKVTLFLKVDWRVGDCSFVLHTALDILNQEYSIIILLILKNPNASILILQTQEAYTNFKNYQLRIILA